MLRFNLIIFIILIIYAIAFAQPVQLDVQGSIQLLNDADIHGVDQIFGHNDLRFYGDSTGGPDLFVQEDGRIGIGTTDAYMDLTIKQKSIPAFAFDGTISNPGGFMIENTVNQAVLLFPSYLGSLHFAFGSGTSFIQRAHISSSNGNFHNTSDRRLKKDITDFEPILAKLLKLKPSYYLFKDDIEGHENIGLIAQEVEPLFPEIVGSYNQLKTICYSKLSVIAIKAIQEQDAEITNFKNRLLAIDYILGLKDNPHE